MGSARVRGNSESSGDWAGHPVTRRTKDRLGRREPGFSALSSVWAAGAIGWLPCGLGRGHAGVLTWQLAVRALSPSLGWVHCPGREPRRRGRAAAPPLPELRGPAWQWGGQGR